ncbi:MAG: hypothetical protein VYE77_10725 [Planctomycetota bacterium]|nr:hypothetical protein [Planctomycetota bacterium]
MHVRLPILVASLILLAMACPGCAQPQGATPPTPPAQTGNPPAAEETTQDPRPEVARQQDPQRQGQGRQGQGQQGQRQQGQGQQGQGQQGQGQQAQGQGQQDPQRAGGNESRRRRWGRGGERAAGAEGAEGADSQSRGGRGRGGFGRFGRGRGPGDGDEAGEGGEGRPGQDAEAKKPEKARPGIAIHDMMVEMHCVRCHPQNDEGMMTRISYVRMSPEGWSQTLKRMIRLHDLQISPSEAKQVVRYLADNNGLTRSEAERSHYESERRVHWSEEHHDEDLRRTCSACHPLGRVFSQARDPEEWQLLRTTHVAMFPGASRQMGGGPSRESSSSRFGGSGGSGGFGGAGGFGEWSGFTGGGGGDSTSGGRGQRGGRSSGSSSRERSSSSSSQRRGSRGDGVIDKLAETQPLFTPEWETWANNRREIPAQGRWTLTGHQIGLGDFVGHVDLVRTDTNEYDTVWTFAFGDGKPIVRRGKGILYAGYSWRGRATDEHDPESSWREVLLMDERWDRMRGRVFQGNHDEIGMDVELTRHRGMPRVHAVAAPWITVPAQGQVLEVLGENFPANVAATDFQLGKGITVTACERIDDNRVHLTIDVAPGTDCGKRQIIYGLEPALCQVQLFDAVDYVRIRPVQGLARIGGIQYPKQFERFEAVAVYRGKDGKNYTDDDVDLWMVEGADWQLKESQVRHSDNDLQFIGKLDPKTAQFTPAVDGPNPARKFSGNNTGEVLVECEVELRVPQRPEPEEPESANLAEGQAGEGEDEEAAGGATAAAADETGNARKPKIVPAEPVAAEASLDDDGPPPTSGKPDMANKKFRARAHLTITVPLYVRWTKLEWKEEQ